MAVMANANISSIREKPTGKGEKTQEYFCPRFLVDINNLHGFDRSS
jgi:hypothetical protein